MTLLLAALHMGRATRMLAVQVEEPACIPRCLEETRVLGVQAFPGGEVDVGSQPGVFAKCLSGSLVSS